MTAKQNILRIAIPSPLRQTFDYLPPKGVSLAQLQPGLRIKVPFGHRQLIGILLEVVDTPQVAAHKLKNIISILDEQPLLSKHLLKLYCWASDYYHHPIGEVIAATLPKLLRQGRAAEIPAQQCYALSALGKEAIKVNQKRAPKQQALLSLLADKPEGLQREAILQQGFSSTILKAVIAKEWLTAITKEQQQVTYKEQPITYELTSYQQQAIKAIQAVSNFKTFLLAGVTGSGKTEVYMQCISTVLQQNKQAVVLVPEISLTPQTAARFQQRFNVPVVLLHSRLTDLERMTAWLQVYKGYAGIIIGTRSAVFAPLLNPGIIILDEEHDASFKQQSGFRYSARDLRYCAHNLKISLLY